MTKNDEKKYISYDIIVAKGLSLQVSVFACRQTILLCHI